MTTPVRTGVPVVPVLVAGAAAQLTDDVLFAFLPDVPVLPALIALALTAGAARFVTREMHGSAVARTGLAVGAVSAGLGLLIGGFGLLTILLAGLTVVAGVAGAVAKRPELRPHD
ncbi:MAG: hypothetical protein OJJ54_05505 [Pseudonocardia sp.]|nr:hypothetical protein [Pseudonocardia sp.]